ncbi:hypothetical protein RTP6_006953 [Batrachochytrium dendrobatidis]
MLVLLLMHPMLLPTISLRAITLYTLVHLNSTSTSVSSQNALQSELDPTSVSALLMACMCKLGPFRTVTDHERVFVCQLFSLGTKNVCHVLVKHAVRLECPIPVEHLYETDQTVARYKHIADGFSEWIKSTDLDAISKTNTWTIWNAKCFARELIQHHYPNGMDLKLYIGVKNAFPPTLPCTNIEKVTWKHPALAQHMPDLDLRYSAIDVVSRDEARKLFIYGYTSPLSHAQQQTVSHWLHTLPQFVHMVGLTKKTFQDLVEHNAIIASETIIALSTSPKLHIFLDALVEISTTMHVMEVVNRVASKNTATLPKDFLHMHLSKCMNACDTIRDKYMQDRQVRLVCGFVQSLVKNQSISIQDYRVDLQTFCLSYSRVKEAVDLYRLVLAKTSQSHIATDD